MNAPHHPYRHDDHNHTVFPDLNGSQTYTHIKLTTYRWLSCRAGRASPPAIGKSETEYTNTSDGSSQKQNKKSPPEVSMEGKAREGGGSVVLIKTHAIVVDWPIMTSHRNDKSGGSHMPGLRRLRLPFTRVIPPAITVMTRALLRCRINLSCAVTNISSNQVPLLRD